MNDITCGICRDLMPLVKDGVAGEDSRAAVERHLEICPDCRARFEGPLPADSEKAFTRLRRRMQLLCALLMVLSLFFGVSLTGGQDLFYNVLLMPLIGALGWLVFRWKALYLLPPLLPAAALITNLLSLLRGAEGLALSELLLWSVIYLPFVGLGMVIAALLQFALKKEDRP